MTKETTQTQPKMKDLARRQIRYICFRLQTEAEGGNKVVQEAKGLMSFVGKIKKHMESQDDFGEWKMFGKTWDVDEKSPLVAVKRSSSIYSDWNNVLKKEVKDFPTINTKSTPPRGPGGKFISKSKQTETPPLAEKKSFWKRLV